MKSIREDAIAKISIGILMTMGAGLVGGTTYLVKLSYASEQHEIEIKQLKTKQATIEQMQVDIAVIKSEVHQLLEDGNDRDR